MLQVGFFFFFNFVSIFSERGLTACDFENLCFQNMQLVTNLKIKKERRHKYGHFQSFIDIENNIALMAF